MPFDDLPCIIHGRNLTIHQDEQREHGVRHVLKIGFCSIWHILHGEAGPELNKAKIDAEARRPRRPASMWVSRTIRVITIADLSGTGDCGSRLKVAHAARRVLV